MSKEQVRGEGVGEALTHCHQQLWKTQWTVCDVDLNSFSNTTSQSLQADQQWILKGCDDNIEKFTVGKSRQMINEPPSQSTVGLLTLKHNISTNVSV